MLKSFASLVSGNLIGFLVGFGALPILSRLYNPNDFGKLAIFLAINSIIVSSACGRFDLAIIAARKNSDVKKLMDLSIKILITFCFLWLIFLVIFNSKIIAYTNLKYIELISAPFYVLGSAGVELFKYFYSKKKKDKSFIYLVVSATTLTSFFSCLFSLTNDKFNGLIAGYITSNVFLFLFLFYKFKMLKKITKSNLKNSLKTFRKYKTFLYYEATSVILNNISISLPTFFISSIFGPQVTGSFNLATRSIMTPFNIISNSVFQFSMRNISELAYLQKSCKGFFYQTLISLVGLCFPVCIFCLFFGKDIIIFIFGKQWALAGQILQILVIAFCIQFLASSLSGIIPVLGYSNRIAIWRIISFITLIIFFFICPKDNSLLFFKYFGFVLVVLYCLYLIIAWKAAEKPKVFS